jgi:diguanylate cyclase (GGDEF)-like protein
MTSIYYKPSRLINWLYMGLIFLILAFGSFILVAHQHEESLVTYKEQSEKQLSLLSDVVKNELLNNNYKSAVNILEKWHKQNNNIYRIVLESGNGFVLANFTQKDIPEKSFNIKQQIHYGYRGTASLKFFNSLDTLVGHRNKEGLDLLFVSIILTLISGQFLWLVEHKRHNRALENLSYRDQLTEIFNRRYFDETMQQEWHRSNRTSQPLSLVFIDIDKFKNYNDNYGHQTGDGCLWEVATALHKTLKRPGEFVARYGGEEFAVVLPNINRRNVKHIAELLRISIEKLAIPCMKKDSVNGYISISLGTATHDKENIHSIEELIQEADKAMYKSKKAGGNIVVTS